MAQPRTWPPAELAEDAGAARGRFRRTRLNEPLEQYTRFFDAFTPIFTDLIDRLPSLADEENIRDVMADPVDDEDVRTGFRYLSAPPISEDDLKILAETTLAANVLRRDAEQARRIRDVVLHIIDPHRFPWIGEEREPTREERRIAVVASAALVAARKVETSRRSGSREQEEDVKNVLRKIGLVEVSRRDIRMLDDAPAPGEFRGESKLGDTRADIVIRLHDRRIMAVECKTSNSAVNSFKRINHEAAGKARAWLTQFGDRQVVPCAVIDGVFNPANLETAQGEGLAIVWGHRLSDLAEFIEETRNPP